MRKFASTAALAALLWMGAAVRAEAAILVRNDNQKWLEFTIYDLTRNELNRGCVPPRQARRWTQPGYEATGGLFFVRGEIKEGKNCAGKTLHDTQFGPALTVNANTTRERTLSQGAAPAFR